MSVSRPRTMQQNSADTHRRVSGDRPQPVLNKAGGGGQHPQGSHIITSPVSVALHLSREQGG